MKAPKLPTVWQLSTRNTSSPSEAGAVATAPPANVKALARASRFRLVPERFHYIGNRGGFGRGVAIDQRGIKRYKKSAPALR
ncbi:MAG: hypothetical protein IT510_07850 [Sulfuritalea sp.]|nr:hypothetical protein [Sulfuritalea sp.]